MNNLHPFCDVQPLDYEKLTHDSSRHLHYGDYKHLKGVDFNSADSEPLKDKIIASMALIIAFMAIVILLLIGV